MGSKLAIVTLFLLSSVALSGCGGGDNATANKTVTASTTEKSTQPQVDPKTAYVQQLNNLNIRTDLQVIGEYGTIISQMDDTNENSVQSLKDFDKTGIPKYQSILDALNKINVPPDYKEFHQLLTKSISDFIVTMKELDQHYSTKDDTNHLAKGGAYYVESTNTIKQLVKKLPFGQLQ